MMEEITPIDNIMDDQWELAPEYQQYSLMDLLDVWEDTRHMAMRQNTPIGAPQFVREACYQFFEMSLIDPNIDIGVPLFERGQFPILVAGLEGQFTIMTNIPMEELVEQFPMDTDVQRLRDFGHTHVHYCVFETELTLNAFYMAPAWPRAEEPDTLMVPKALDFSPGKK